MPTNSRKTIFSRPPKSTADLTRFSSDQTSHSIKGSLQSIDWQGRELVDLEEVLGRRALLRTALQLVGSGEDGAILQCSACFVVECIG